jgi:hypothetical protein
VRGRSDRRSSFWVGGPAFQLPARFFATAAAKVVATAAPTTPVAPAPTTKSTAPSAAPAAATKAALWLGPGFVDHERAPVELMLVQLADSSLRFLIRAHLDEGEAAGSSSSHVAHHADGVDLASAAEQFSELILGGRVR